MNRVFGVLCLIVFCSVLPALDAATVSTPAGLVARAIAKAFERYRNDGKDLKTASMDTILEYGNRTVIESVAGQPLSSRISLTSSKPIIVAGKGIALAVTNDVIEEDVRDTQGRYVVWLNGDEVSYSWEPLQAADAIFAANGIILETTQIWKQPDALPLGGGGISPADLRGQPTPKQTPKDLPAPSGSSDAMPAPAKQPSAPKLATQSAALPQPESKSWLLWLLVVIAATVGAVLLFLRKSPK